MQVYCMTLKENLVPQMKRSHFTPAVKVKNANVDIEVSVA